MNENIKYLDKIINVVIDRPLGSSHPKYPKHIYPVNYGYVPNTISGDGKELDCFVLGEYEPVNEYKGKCIAIIHRFNDNDDKLVIAPENVNFTNAEIRALTNFQERFFESEIIRSSNYLEFNKNIPRPENKFVFISLGEIQFMLQENSDNDKWEVAKLTYPFGNGINFQLEVENANKIYDNLKNNNYKIAFEIEENWYRQGNRLLGNKEFLVQDPDGYLLRFSEDLGEKEI